MIIICNSQTRDEILHLILKSEVLTDIMSIQTKLEPFLDLSR